VGTTPQQAAAESWTGLFGADELPIVLERWTAAVASSQPFDMLLSMKGADGQARPFLTRAAPARDAAGRVTGWFGINTDVVELRQQRQTAEEDNRRIAGELDDLKQLFEQAPSFMTMLRGPEHRIVLTNPPYMQLIGHREVLGRTVAEALPEAAEQGFVAILDQVYRSGEAYSASGARYAVQVVPGGPVNERFVDFVYQPVTGPDGAVVGIFVEGYDITERVRADEHRQDLLAAMRQSEERFRALVEASSDVVYRMSADWSEMGQLVGRDFIASTTDPSRTWLEAYIPPQDRQLVQDTIADAIRTRSVFQLEHRVLRVDGTVGWTFSRAVPLLDDQGEVTEWFGAASDITDRVEAEAQLKALVAEKEALAQQNELMAREMSHRIMNSFQLMESMFSMQTRAISDPAAREVVDQAGSRIRAMALVHRQLFRITREDITGLNAGEYLRGLVDELGPAFVTANRCRIEVEADTDIEVSTGQGMALGLLVTELVINACKHAFKDNDAGQIDVRLHRVEGERLRMVVEDDGAGLPQGFDTKASSGLGMRLLHSFVRQLDGNLAIEGPPGSRFVITFPQ
jgi:two-component sensor histidine kinase